MFSTKRLTALASALMLVTGAAQAQQMKPAAPKLQTVSVRVPSANIDTGTAVSAGAAPASAASQPVSQPPAQTVPAAATPHLSIDEIDQITRSKIARQLAGDSGPQGSAVTLNTPAPATAPVSAPVTRPITASARVEPVRFVGAFSDVSGQSVLYEYRSASYPAHVGAKLLNGWTVKRVDGFVVTVGDGKRTWTETISGGTTSTSDNPQQSGGPTRTLSDLGGPLPSSFPLSATAR
ncbi:hypothetical protein [Paraburkholderia atlantica]|uniref:Type IV pilus biogenesis protein PilP n=1 Tax=Paraburkholderia atlantica TaxID=2654982 RepID=D5WNZ7_PARAM|nr:hypothetical protein [Paraburkholderia atlantica]ADG20620.1 conserved hypothetical protein [Paraburkholderia atlantica]MBB5510587.1 hypothetical protein [Paraburkholderia atlantica]